MNYEKGCSMSENNIIGRQAEKVILQRLINSDYSEFLAVYGRRRVGKTYLITEFFEDKGVLLEITGSPDASKELHLSRFSVELSHTFSLKKESCDFSNWNDAFLSLIEALDCYHSQKPDEKIILFFDEIPWLDRNKSGFLSALDYCWNKFLSKKKYNYILTVICGSAASWMIKRVVNNKGGLHNRLTETINLAPFSLSETKTYLESRNVTLENKQIVEIYMAFGGIPAYLSHVLPGLSSSQIINEVCFTKGRFLNEEFHRLYSSLFKNYHNHVKIIRSLADSPKGLTRGELLKKAALSTGGEGSVVLQELKESGFISSYSTFKKKSRSCFYRLTDEYSLFYLKWIEPASLTDSIDPNYWLKMSQRQSWLSWAGYAFENICLKHIQEIKLSLGISGVLTTESQWEYKPPAQTDENGVQVDLIIARADKTINLCEIKFSKDEFSITPEYKKKLEYKKSLFRQKTKCKDLLLTTMITTYGVKENQNYLGTVDSQRNMDVLFD